MGIFGAILEKLRHHASGSAAQASSGTDASRSAEQQQAQTSGQQQAQTAGQTALQGSAQPALQHVDIEAVLAQRAAQKGGGGNYRESIVDLLKLLDLDSSLDARRELAGELNVHAGKDGSAEQNIALHKAVMQKIAENGGKVPESMKH
jgi:hypothetical protein